MREFFEARGQAYALRIASSFILALVPGTKLTCAEAVSRLVRDKRRWKVRSAGKGSKGDRWYAWAWIAAASLAGPPPPEDRRAGPSTRHTVLVMAALAVCAVTAALLRDRTDTEAPLPASPDQPPPAEPGMIPLTIPEIRRLLAAVPGRPHPPRHAARWLDWRRRHQARSRWYHHRTRLARDAETALAS